MSKLRVINIDDMVQKVSEIIGDVTEGENKMENKVIIVELVYPNPKLIGGIKDFNIENYGNHYIPKIRIFEKSEEPIKNEFIYSTIIGLNREGESDNGSFKKVCYPVSQESYSYASKVVNNEDRTLDEDLASGRFFNRAVHEVIAEQFFNSEGYLSEIFNRGIIDSIKDGDLKKDCTHTFLTDPVVLEKMITPSTPIYDEEDLDRIKELLEKIGDYRKSLKSLTFNLGKKNMDGDIISSLVNSLGYTKESINNLEYAESMLSNRLYKKDNKVKKEDISNINTDRYVSEFKFKNYHLNDTSIKDRQKIVNENFEKFNAKFDKLTRETAKGMSKALSNMKKFVDENKDK